MRDVDCEQRRQAIAEIAVRVIAADGLEAATIRKIAAEAGYSTTVITHYFDSKDELLHAAYVHMANALSERLADIEARSPGDVLDTLMAMIPLEEGMRQHWQVYIAFWQRADRDPVFRREHKRGMTLARTQLETLLHRRMGVPCDLAKLARRLIALVHGISMQLLFDPQSWSPAEIRDTFAMEIASVSGSAARARRHVARESGPFSPR